jgi:hypothetical protein
MTRLDDLLAQWARSHRLTHAQSEQVRGVIVRSEAQQDEDWLHDLLRPVTALLDGPHNLYDTLSRGHLKLT